VTAVRAAPRRASLGLARRWLLRSALVAAVAAPRPVRADQGGAVTVGAGLRYAGGAGPDSVVLAIDARFLRAPGWAGGIDLAAGGGASGVAYEATVWPAGAGLRVGPWLDLALRGGTGIDGMTGARELGVRIAGELTADVALPRIASLGLAARATRLALAPGRDAELAVPGADELIVTAAVRLGRAMREYNGRAARGIAITAGLRIDRAGSALLVGVGYGADIRWVAGPAAFPGWLSSRDAGTR
jgi:hypothetical protein